MLNIMQQHICDLIIKLLETSDNSLIFKEIKDQLPCKINDDDLNDFLYYLETQGKIKQSRVIIPKGNYTGWTINTDKGKI